MHACCRHIARHTHLKQLHVAHKYYVLVSVPVLVFNIIARAQITIAFGFRSSHILSWIIKNEVKSSIMAILKNYDLELINRVNMSSGTLLQID